MVSDKIEDVVVKRERADAHRIEVDAAFFEPLESLGHRRRRRPEIKRPKTCRLGGWTLYRRWHQTPGGLEFMQQPLHVVDIVRTLFGIAGVAVLAGAAGEKGPPRGVRARIGAIWDPVAVDIKVT